MQTIPENLSRVVENPVALARELESERRKNRQLTLLLETERVAREKAEAALLMNTRMSYQSDSSHSERGDDGTNDEGTLGKDSPASMRAREIHLLTKLDIVKREKEVTEIALNEMKRQMAAMHVAAERTAQKVEEEEDMLSNTLLRKLRLVTRDREQLELQLSRSSRSSSLDHSCDSGSITSEQPSLREADTRSELSSISNLACCRSVNFSWL